MHTLVAALPQSHILNTIKRQHKSGSRLGCGRRFDFHRSGKISKTARQDRRWRYDQNNCRLDEEGHKHGELVLDTCMHDEVVVFEAESQKEAMKMSIEISQWVTTETLVAIPRDEAVKLL